MLSRRDRPQPEDPSVALVERILDAAAAPSVGAQALRDERLVATYAIWLCACETLDDSPVWLLYAIGQDSIGWCRLGEREISEVVDAAHVTGCHPEPAGVLKWLRGEWPYPWRGPADFPEHSFIYNELRRRIIAP
ncbi:hypothetical protein FE697_003680 [Mumia zhuanghuii]|uniref:Uncharacterized protein n=2 Tax=Mumia TaxID=1546255 RepID=A0ABW1QNK1_9ACTN|nr:MULTISPECIES: hypothetical protein [Mumia]KAA1425005.1 hypothetical protein FE697_003680 [Mumia zhuanghuii]